MQNDILASLTRLSDDDLVARLKGLVARDHDLTAQIVAHLAELDTRDVFLREGYGSLFVYCRDALGLSEWEAYNRIEVARAAVLESARGKRKPEVEEMVARLSPRPDVPASVRRLPAIRPGPLPLAMRVSVPDAPACPAVHPPPASPPGVVPLSPDRYRLQLTIGGDTLEKLHLAKDMLGHVNPSGDDAVVLDRALTALLTELAKKKFADTRQPRPSRGTKAGARDPSAPVKRAVWLRDLGRCAFIGPNGHRCNERRFVEFHHVDP